MTFERSLWEAAEPSPRGRHGLAQANAIAAFWNKPVNVRARSGAVYPINKQSFAKDWSALRKRLSDGERCPDWVGYLLANLRGHLCHGARYSSIELNERDVEVIKTLAAAEDLTQVAKPFKMPRGLSDEIIRAEWDKPHLSKKAKFELAMYRRRKQKAV